MPWILGADDHGPTWTLFDPERALAALTRRLCQVCGEPLGRAVALGAVGDLQAA